MAAIGYKVPGIIHKMITTTADVSTLPREETEIEDTVEDTDGHTSGPELQTATASVGHAARGGCHVMEVTSIFTYINI